MSSRTISQFITDICAFSPRQFEGALLTAEYIKKTLTEIGIPFASKTHVVDIPKTLSAQCHADEKSVPCLCTSFISGKIKGSEALISSLISSRYLSDVPNINFNPRTEAGVISRSNFYFAPSIAISHSDIPRLLEAKKVEVRVEVLKKKVVVETIYAGNVKTPAHIIFAHYDSIGTGALDNASGVAVVLGLLNRIGEKSLKKNLFVFDGNEELSYDKPTYWGHGFRVFEKRHKDLLEKARAIIVVDCVGNDKPEISIDPKIINLAFPLKEVEQYSGKIKILGGNIPQLMTIYHTDGDIPDNLSEKYLDQSLTLLISLLKNTIT